MTFHVQMCVKKLANYSLQRNLFYIARLGQQDATSATRCPSTCLIVSSCLVVYSEKCLEGLKHVQYSIISERAVYCLYKITTFIVIIIIVVAVIVVVFVVVIQICSV